MTSPQNKRFFIWYHNAYVKITLKPGKPINLRYSEPTDEGYSYREDTYRLYSDGSLEWEHETGGRDCDGPISHESTFTATAMIDDEGHLTPDWKETRHVVNDTYARMAGY